MLHPAVPACGDRSPIPSRCSNCVINERKVESHDKEKSSEKKGLEDDKRIRI